MPSRHCLWLDEHERRAPVPPCLGQHDPQQPISPPELRTGDRASQYVELLAEREVLEDEFVMSAAGQRQRADEYKGHFQHASILSFYAQQINRHPSRAVLGERQERLPYAEEGSESDSRASVPGT
ncbi:MAG: hypothetical protein GEU99_12725 [Luteitalea sp.]|nr:hypothetical protein [Luteitalea sp.]